MRGLNLASVATLNIIQFYGIDGSPPTCEPFSGSQTAVECMLHIPRETLAGSWTIVITTGDVPSNTDFFNVVHPELLEGYTAVDCINHSNITILGAHFGEGVSVLFSREVGYPPTCIVQEVQYFSITCLLLIPRQSVAGLWAVQVVLRNLTSVGRGTISFTPIVEEITATRCSSNGLLSLTSCYEGGVTIVGQHFARSSSVGITGE